MANLATAAHTIEERFGLASLEGGRHPGWGTANRIVPLGSTYLELVAVMDEAEAGNSTFGRWVTGARAELGRPLGWAVRTGALDDVARRLGLSVTADSRATPGGELVRWRSAGIERAVREPTLPFFIEWEAGAPFPGRAKAAHRTGPVAITRLVLHGVAARLDAWLGNHGLPIEVRAGEPAVASAVLSTAEGEIVLKAGFLSAT